MIKMVAIRPLRYATRRLLPDDGFDVRTERDARMFRLIGKARDMTPEEIAKAEKQEQREQKKEETRETAASVLAKVDDVPFLRFKSMASEVLGDDTPSTKADIIAALEKRAGLSS